jgi:hypothetical protein
VDRNGTRPHLTRSQKRRCTNVCTFSSERILQEQRTAFKLPETGHKLKMHTTPKIRSGNTARISKCLLCLFENTLSLILLLQTGPCIYCCKAYHNTAQSHKLSFLVFIISKMFKRKLILMTDLSIITSDELQIQTPYALYAKNPFSLFQHM